MSFKVYVLVLVTLAVAVNFSSAIECDFKYVSDNVSPVEMPTSTQATTETRVSMRPRGIFNCEDPLDDYEPITDSSVNSRVKPMGFDTRFGEDEYESASSDCTSSKKTIQPKALNNVYNKLMNVVNNASFIQSIEIDECTPKNEPCNSGSEPPVGKKLMCRQKYVKVILKAFKEDNKTIFDEQFYYPSHCICELVQKRKKTA